MGKRVPNFICEMYGSAHKFRANKRLMVARMLKDAGELRRGSAHFPDGAKRSQEIVRLLEELRKELSTRSWGR